MVTVRLSILLRISSYSTVKIQISATDKAIETRKLRNNKQ